LGPFRSITRAALNRFHLEEKTFGWTIELLIKALQQNMKVCQVDVPYRVRLEGASKVSKTVSGVLKAETRILWLISSTGSGSFFKDKEEIEKAP